MVGSTTNQYGASSVAFSAMMPLPGITQSGDCSQRTIMDISFARLMAAAGQGLLIAFLLRPQGKRNTMRLSLTGFLAVSAAVSVVAIILESIPESWWLRQTATYGWAISLVPLFILTAAHGNWDRNRPVALALVAWFILLVLVIQLTPATPLITPGAGRLLLFPELHIGGLFFLLCWAAMAAGLVALVLYRAAQARLPLHANRLLHWAGALALVFAGQFFFSLEGFAPSSVGAMILLLGSGGLVYGVISYHVFDIQNLGRLTLGHLLSITAIAAVIIAAILATAALTNQTLSGEAIPTVIGLAFFLGTVYRVGSAKIDRFITRTIIAQRYDPAAIVETYARTIGNILDIETLSSVAIDTIREVLGFRHGAMMLVKVENNTAVVLPAGGAGRMQDSPMSFAVDGPIFAHFLVKRRPLLQYDIEVLPEFQSLTQKQRRWLAEMQAGVYVPIMTDGLPIGLLAIGPRASGAPYRGSELQLLQVLGGQSVVALTNARLFDDMKNLNAEIQLLNEDLRLSNERLQHMDLAKSDFITIASHELRTPLTQVKGYTDLIEAMIEADSLTSEQARRLTGRVSRAVDQLDRVINSMLDASQIDVDAMTLNLAETRLDAVLRIAVEPLAEAMRERRLALSITGIRNLPPIMADFQRLVQAVSNLLLNAVRYTPDGGRITISAQVLQDERDADREIELIIADTGVGIDPRDHELIYQKFFRASDPQLHSTGGTDFMAAGPGLGLAIVRGIIQAHGGRIRVESEGHDPERCPGSEFHVILPIKPGEGE